MSRVRLDHLLVERGLVDSRERGQRLIMAGEVLVNDQIADKPGTLVGSDAVIRIKEPLPYVSRGGLKLAAALDQFPIAVTDAICADVGASTGGFSDCLLQRGAARVYAIDVGYGQLDWKVRSNTRVTVLDRTNARYLESLPEPIDLATIDTSFISLRLIFPAVLKWLKAEADCVALIKPQFEAGRERIGKGGVVRDPAVHVDVLHTILRAATELDLQPIDLIRSPIQGPAGNIEFLVWLRRGLTDRRPLVDDLIQVAMR